MKHPFSTILRLPYEIHELESIQPANLVPTLIEEQLHILLFPFSSYFGSSHLAEETTVDEALKLFGLPHCGTRPPGTELARKKIREAVKNPLEAGDIFGAVTSLVKLQQSY